MIKEILTILLGITTTLTGWLGGGQKQEPQLGAFSDPFLSVQLAANPVNGKCITTDGTNNSWGNCGGGGSGGGSWSTTTAGAYYFNYPNNSTDVVGIGSTSGTSTSIFYFDPNNNSARIGSTNTASTTVMGNTFFSSRSQGYSFLGSNGFLSTVSTSTLAGQVFPFTSATNYNSTSTAIGFLNGLFSTASSTFSGNFYLPSLTQGFAYVGSSGKVNTVASSSILLSDLGGAVTDAQVPNTITVDLATAATSLAGNGTNCSAGSYPLGVDASGNAENCTVAGTGGGSDPFSHFNGVNSATTTSMAIGTTTAGNNQLTIASTTAPQLSLSNGAGILQWIMRNAGGNLYVATTTVDGTATTSPSALTINGSTGQITYPGRLTGPTFSDPAKYFYYASTTNFNVLRILGDTQAMEMQMTALDVPNPYFRIARTDAARSFVNVLWEIANTGGVDQVVNDDGSSYNIWVRPGVNGTQEAAPRLRLRTDQVGAGASGALVVGDGSGSGDANLYWSAADTLKTDDLLTVGNGLLSQASSTFVSALRLPSLSQGSLYVGSTGLLNTTPTTTVTCSGAASCTSFVAFGSSPITITASGGGTGGGTWATTTSQTSSYINYPLNNTDIVTIGGTATTAAPYWFDPNTKNALIGNSLTASTTIMGNATTTGSMGMGAIYINGDYITDLTGTGISMSSGALTATLGTNITPAELNSAISVGNAIIGTNAAGTQFQATGTVDALTVPAIIGTTTKASSLAGALTVSGLLTDTYASSTYTSFVTASTTKLFVGQQALIGTTTDFTDALGPHTLTVAGPDAKNIFAFTNSNNNVNGAVYVEAGNTTPFQMGSITNSDFGFFTNNNAPQMTLFTNGGTGIGLNYAALTTQPPTNGLIVEGLSGFGTTTAVYPVTSFSATLPQLSLSAGAGLSQWTARNAGGIFYLSTTTVAGTATSTVSALSINANGQLQIPNLKSCDTIDTDANGVLSCGSDQTSAGGSGGYDFPTVAAWGNSTSTTLGFLNGFLSTASSTQIGDFKVLSGYVGIGTTSPLYQLHISSSTAPQIALGSGAGNAMWTFRSAGSNLYFSTTTVAGTSTSTPFISFLNAGNFLLGTTTPWLNSAINAVGTTTIKGQFATIAASTTANTTQTIDWSTGNTQKIMLTGNTNIVVNSTSSNPIDGGKYTLKICQDPTGSRTLTWANPISLRWWNATTTITSTANKCTWIGMIYTEENGNSIYSVVASSTNIDIK